MAAEDQYDEVRSIRSERVQVYYNYPWATGGYQYPESVLLTVREVQNPVTGDWVKLDIPARCEDDEDVDWVLSTWGAVFELQWRIDQAERLAQRNNVH